MSYDNPRAGFSSASEFTVSGLPWVTSSVAPAAGSPQRFDFPKVTRTITVSNRDSTFGNTLSIAFTRGGIISGTGGIGQQKFILHGGQSETFELRVNRLFLQGENGTPPYSILAGLTAIDANSMPVLTGSSWEGIG